MDYKYIIVGQGIAGSLIAMECLQRNIPFLVVDDPTKSRASRVAAGIINPLTGRKFVKTWMYDELVPIFKSTYQKFEEISGEKLLFEKEIIRVIPSVSDQNNWDAKTLSPEYENYMNSDVKLDEYETCITQKFNYGSVQGFQLKIGTLIQSFRNFLSSKSWLLEEEFNFELLSVAEKFVEYKSIKAASIIFCEGYKVSENPFFNHLDFAPAKGEVLLIKCAELKTERLLKDQIFIAPFEKGLYWVGATYSWENLDDKVTQEKREWLINALNKVLKTPYEVVDQIAGIRPSTNTRRPYIGTHKKYDNLHIFNGLGTKGSSLGPYWANHFMNHIENGDKLSNDVDIQLHNT